MAYETYGYLPDGSFGITTAGVGDVPDLGTITVVGRRAGTSEMSISSFKAAIGTVARPNLFMATLYGSADGVDADSIDDTFSFRCETAEIPGRSIITNDEVGGGGTALKIASDVQYNDINLTIICSEDMKERFYFENWMDAIVGSPGRSKTGSNSGLVSFYENYAMNTTLEVDSLNSAGQKLYTSRMYYVFPTSLSPMSASWEDTNTYQRFQVTMNYRFYTYNRP